MQASAAKAAREWDTMGSLGTAENTEASPSFLRDVRSPGGGR